MQKDSEDKALWTKPVTIVKTKPEDKQSCPGQITMLCVKWEVASVYSKNNGFYGDNSAVFSQSTVPAVTQTGRRRRSSDDQWGLFRFVALTLMPASLAFLRSFLVQTQTHWRKWNTSACRWSSITLEWTADFQVRIPSWAPFTGKARGNQQGKKSTKWWRRFVQPRTEGWTCSTTKRNPSWAFSTKEKWYKKISLSLKLLGVRLSAVHRTRVSNNKPRNSLQSLVWFWWSAGHERWIIHCLGEGGERWEL